MISPPATTKDRILDAAERLFSERGFAETSLRAITSEAGANLASVNYYFQSKDALIQAVFARRLGPINQMRIRMLDELEAHAGDCPVALEDLLRVFIEPVIEVGGGADGRFARLFGRFFMEPGPLFQQVFENQFAEARERFLPALELALPGVPREEKFWRMFFMMGAASHLLVGRHHLQVISQGACDTSDSRAAVARLIAFVAPGFRAQVPEGGKP
jgi:AcrR family transcriptional regulator